MSLRAKIEASICVGVGLAAGIYTAVRIISRPVCDLPDPEPDLDDEDLDIEWYNYNIKGFNDYHN